MKKHPAAIPAESRAQSQHHLQLSFLDQFHNMIRSEIPHNPPAGFRVRDATLEDVDSLTALWYSSFNPSHKFWDIMTPDDEMTRRWWRDTWTMGIEAGPETLRTFVVEDLSKDHKPVAFSRWNVPQAHGKQDIPLPPYPVAWDSELTEAFWGGMPRNRLDVMGPKSHWMLEFVGVDKDYQEKGLGFTLVNWGCQQADREGLEVYLDATIKGLPFYRRHFGFQDRKVLMIPPRSDTFGAYELMAVVRPALTVASNHPAKVPLAQTSVTEILEIQ